MQNTISLIGLRLLSNERSHHIQVVMIETIEQFIPQKNTHVIQRQIWQLLHFY